MKPIHRNSRGFTLIELLIVVSIIGILAAIAINQFAQYKTNSQNAMAKSDLKNGITAQEAFYSDSSEYVTCSGPVNCQASLEGLVPSKNSDGSIAVTTYNFTSASDTFSGTAAHAAGDVTYTFDSSNGTIDESN